MTRITDVAKEAGYAPATISRYLNKKIELPAETANRIDEAVKRLGYRPNLLAKRLSTGRTETIGLVAPDISNPFFAELALAIEDEAERHGYFVLMSSTRGQRAREIACLKRHEDHHVDGLVMMTNEPDDGTLAANFGGHTHVVLVDEDVPGVSVPRIFVHNSEGAFEATKYLVAAGHRKIAHIGGPENLMSVRERMDGMLEAMRLEGLQVKDSWIQLGDYSRSFGIQAIDRILEQPERPTAVFCGSDYIAIGVMHRVRELGLRVPEDLSIVGFDDMPFSSMLAPALTTVRQPVEKLGKQAFRTLHALINQEETEAEQRLPVELVIRQSVFVRSP